jgi:hypothetical protein
MAKGCVGLHKEIDGLEIGEVGYMTPFGPATQVGGSLEDPTFGYEEKHRGTKSAMGHIPVAARMML